MTDQLFDSICAQINAAERGWLEFDKQHVCYVVQGSSGGPFKIGNATCMSKRMNGLQNGNPNLLKVRALFRGGAETEREFHKLFADYRRVGEWFDEKAVALMCSVIRQDERLLWGSPWTEEVYRQPSPTFAEIRTAMNRIMLEPKTQESLRTVLQNPKHKAYRDVVRLFNRCGVSLS